jgi:hypothetical protein
MVLDFEGLPGNDDISVDETSLAVNLRSESICTSCRSGCDDDDAADDLDNDVLRAVRKTDLVSGTEDDSVREDNDCFRVIEELELNKYEMEQPASEVIQMQQQKLAQEINSKGRMDPSKRSLLKRKSTKSLITSMTGISGGGSSTTDLENMGIITQEGKKHIRKECSNSDCGLCFLIDSSLEGNDWDQLDTETVTLMDVLERLSKILAEKAKTLINKKSASPKPPQHCKVTETINEGVIVENKSDSVTGTPDKTTGGKEFTRHASPSTALQKKKRQFRKEPLKGLRASGVAVKKVEHRRRVIVVKDGSSQYYIQGE